MIDRPKLIKLMMMTQSSNDGEALTALRKANALLAADNVNWSEFISGIKQQAPRPAPRPKGRGFDAKPEADHREHHRFTDPAIPRMLASLLRDSKGGFRDFIESIDEFWSTKGFLTEKQYDAVLNAYERAK